MCKSFFTEFYRSSFFFHHFFGYLNLIPPFFLIFAEIDSTGAQQVNTDVNGGTTGEEAETQPNE